MKGRLGGKACDCVEGKLGKVFTVSIRLVCVSSSSMPGQRGAVFLLGGDSQSWVSQQLPKQPDVLLAAAYGAR